MATSKRTNATTRPTITRNTQKRKSVSNHIASSPAAKVASRPLPTIPDAPPGPLVDLKNSELSKYRFGFSRWDREEIAKGIVTENGLYNMDPDGVYMLGFWNYFDWWVRVSEELAQCLLCKVGETQLTDEHREFTKKLRKLEAAVLSRFPAAHLGEPCFHVCSYKPKIALLKAYGALASFLSETAVRLWPTANLHWLTNHE